MDGTPLETSVKQVNRLRVPPLGLTLAVLAGAFLCYAPAVQSQAPAVPATGQQVVLVTGSTSGLGREVALRLGSKGAHVIVHGRDQERGMQVVDEINRVGPGNARFYSADLASFAAVRALGESLLADYDRLDVLVNNAGFGSAPMSVGSQKTATSSGSRSTTCRRSCSLTCSCLDCGRVPRLASSTSRRWPRARSTSTT